jgi:hypothetical protein
MSLPQPGLVPYSSEQGRYMYAPGEVIAELIVKWTTKQRFYITDNGYMGLAHQSCK